MAKDSGYGCGGSADSGAHGYGYGTGWAVGCGSFGGIGGYGDRDLLGYDGEGYGGGLGGGYGNSDGTGEDRQ